MTCWMIHMTLTHSWHELPNVQCDLGQHVIWAAFLSPEKLAGETGKEKWRVKYHGRLSPLMLVMLTMMMVLNSCWCWWCCRWLWWQWRWGCRCWRCCWWVSSQTWVYTSAGRPSKVNEERKLAGKKKNKIKQNKLARLEATLVQNSAEWPAEQTV